MASEDRGRRAADGAYEWTVHGGGEDSFVIRHRAPDVVTHLYQPRGINEPVLLYRGPFNTQGDERSERPYDGDVRLAWLPTPRIEARGERDTAPGDIEALLESGADTNIWHQRLQVHLPGTPGVLPLPSEEAPPWSHRPGSAYLGPTDVYPPDIGDGAALTRVTGLVPNGWDSFDGSRIADPSDRRCTWFGRAIAHGGGWVLELDTVSPDQDFQKELRQRGGYGITHAVSLSRAGGATFTAADATDALHAVRAAFSLILGRRSDVVLAVGWNHDQPVWTRWTAGRVDPFREPGSWLDASIAAAQAAGTIGRFLDCWLDPLRRDTLLYATSYYTQALALGVELGTAAAVSGLSLVGYSWLVEDERIYSSSAWNNMKPQTESQLRALLEFNKCRISTAVPSDFVNLQAVAQRLNAAKEPNEADRDGLGCVIAMRNHVIHPTRQKRTRWSAYEWTEARTLAVHFLELALLAYVGYRQPYHPRISANRYLGYVEDVPWVETEA